MSAILKEVLTANENYAADFGDKKDLALPPARGFAILTCMDARLDPAKYAGLSEGDAHVIRNAGGRASDDAIRSLVISQRMLGTHEVVVINHTGCGMMTFTDAGMRSELARETGQSTDLQFGAFTDLETNVREQVAKIRAHPWVKPVPVHGMVYEVESGRVREVDV